MKKYYFYFLIALCIGLSACSKDDSSSSNPGESSLLVGTWVDDYLSGDYDVTETLIFKSDGTGKWNYDYYYENSSRIADRSRYTINYSFNTTTKELIINLTDGSSYNATKNFIVRELTEDKLQLDWASGGVHGTFYRQ